MEKEERRRRRRREDKEEDEEEEESVMMCNNNRGNKGFEETRPSQREAAVFAGRPSYLILASHQ